SVSDLEAPTPELLEKKAIEVGEAAYRAREAEFGAPVLRDLERHLYLYTLDEHWRDHLYELDHLKGGIGLRAYGQRDPLIEYKKEAFTLFETLVGEVRDEFVQRLFRVQLAPEAVQQIERRPRPRQMVAQQKRAPARLRLAAKKPKTSGRARKAAPAPEAAAAGEGGALVIVESPAKSRTLSKFLGRGYNVMASNGHIMDLPKSKLGVDL